MRAAVNTDLMNCTLLDRLLHGKVRVPDGMQRWLTDLPILSAYLGHVHVADTQWYLNGSPQLMREAMRRLEQRWEDWS